MYSEKVLEHFLHPQNVGSIEDADGFGQAEGGPRCPEDLAHVWIQVTDGRITEIRHKTLGCPVAIAASSMTCHLAKGKTLDEALQITPEVVAAALGDIPERKSDSIVGPKALHQAIADYQARRK
ncbi:MAG: iron-sulfur cluster assembly scaffold protein [Anaerolineae bacterium]|nr:iron-sulfur cluster assembly scaffold protein [Anaerolineae bacterium]